MRLRGIGAIRRAEADDRARDDQGRALRVGLRLGDHRIDRRLVVDVGEMQDLPAIAGKALRDVVAAAEIDAAIDGDLIIVEEADQLPELLMTSEGGRFMGDALHEAAIASDEPGVVIDRGLPLAIEARGEVCLGDRHPDGVGDALAEWAGGRLDAWGVPDLGVSRCLAPPLTEGFELIEGEIVATQMKRGVEQHRRVPRGEHHAVAIGPVRIRGVVSHMTRVERVGERGEGHRGPRVAGFGLLYRIHGEGADRVDGELLQGGV